MKLEKDAEQRGERMPTEDDLKDLQENNKFSSQLDLNKPTPRGAAKSTVKFDFD